MKYIETTTNEFNNKMILKVAEVFYTLPEDLQRVIIEIYLNQRECLVTHDNKTTAGTYEFVLRLFSINGVLPFDVTHILRFCKEVAISGNTEVKEQLQNKKSPAKSEA